MYSRMLLTSCSVIVILLTLGAHVYVGYSILTLCVSYKLAVESIIIQNRDQYTLTLDLEYQCRSDMGIPEIWAPRPENSHDDALISLAIWGPPRNGHPPTPNANNGALAMTLRPGRRYNNNNNNNNNNNKTAIGFRGYSCWVYKVIRCVLSEIRPFAILRMREYSWYRCRHSVGTPPPHITSDTGSDFFI